MTEKGVIRELKGNLLIVAPDKSIACFGCMNEECRNSGGFITAENSLGLSLAPGQTVEVKASGVSILGQAAAAILPPALGFTAGYAFTRFFFPAAGEGASALLGVVCLFAAAFIVYRARKKFPAAGEYTVTRIIA